jgi:hypothetical protein
MGSTVPSADYQSTIGARLAYRERVAGKEPGDPAKAAQAIMRIAYEEHPPLRLPLGRDAFQLARQVDHANLAETERWEQLITSTDYEDHEEDPLAPGMGFPPASQDTTT